MFRLKKLLGILIVLGIVFFIICDEKGYKIKLENNRIAFEKIEEKPELVNEESLENVVYKNSDLVHLSILFKEKNFLRKSDGIDPEFFIVYKNSNSVHIYPGFENPVNLRNSAGMDPEFLAKLEKEKAELEARDKSMKYKGPNIISMGEENDISDIIKSNKTQGTKVEYTGTSHDVNLNKSKTEEPELEELEPNNDTVSLTQTGYFSPNIGDAIGMERDSEDINKENIKEKSEEKTKENVEEKVEEKIDEKVVEKVVEKVEVENKTEKVKPTTDTSVSIQKDIEKNTLETENTGPNQDIDSKEPEDSVVLDNGENITNTDEQLGITEPTEEIIIEEINYEIEGELYNRNLINKYTKEKNDFIESISLKDVIIEKVKIPAESVNRFKGGKYKKLLLRDLKNKEFNIIKPEEIEDEENIQDNENTETIEEIENIEKIENNTPTYKVERYEGGSHKITLRKGILKLYEVERYEGGSHKISLSKGILKLYEVEKYPLVKHNLNIKKGVKIEPEFVVPENLEKVSYETGYTDNSISELENIISSDEIDINTLESENDEFLQAVFDKTKDTKVMNLIVETYLSEYQFVKAKKFIESLSGTYLDNLDPLLNLKVVFNSFALTSNTTNSTLTSMIEDYKSKNLISVEDRLWYLGVIALMQQDYDRFFELAKDFSVGPHQNFAAKLQGYKDQIAKQMGMPDYYFDTLVSLELFNQGFFQPAKVLALYSLQQNSNYILPYQILAYANFLTNSWDTSIEYLKKLVDIDPTNAEKYRFLMGVAYYWDEKYQQSVVMLSLVKKESLRIDAERYLIRDYILLDQKTKLISIRNKLLGYDNLVASDFYTYFYEAFYRPFAEGSSYQIFAYDTELANKMIRVCSMKLSDEDKAVCNYGMIGKNVALGQYDGLEESLLKLAKEYPQGYLYQALGEYYMQKGDFEKAKAYLLKAVSMTKKTSEVVQIKKLLQNIME